MYIPPPKNIPLFDEKGEVQIEIGASTNSLYLTGSYAFSEKYALIANGSMSYPGLFKYSNYGNFILDYLLEGPIPYRSFEAGIGRYNLFSSSSGKILEVFVGAEYGLAYNLFERDDKINHLQGFVQVNTGKKINNFEIGWSLCVAYSSFHSQDVYYKSVFEKRNFIENRRFIDHLYFQVFHLEPLFFSKFGGERLQGFLRCGFNLTFPTTNPSLITTVGVEKGYTLIHLSMGLSYRFF